MTLSLEQLVGVGCRFDVPTDSLIIPNQILRDAGLDFTEDIAGIPAFAALCKTVNEKINLNAAPFVPVVSSFNTIAPVDRNDSPRTEFNFNFSFYGSFNEPLLDPDDIA